MAVGVGHGGEPIDRAAFESFSHRYLAAWNAHDPTAVAACAAEDVLWDSPALPRPGHGRGAAVGVVAATVAAFPDYQFTQTGPWAIAEDRLTAYLPWRMTGTNLGAFDPPGYAPTGRSVDLPGIEVLRFRDGLISHYRSLYDYALVARQLGLRIERGGRLERAAVRAQRLFVRLWPSTPSSRNRRLASRFG